MAFPRLKFPTRTKYPNLVVFFFFSYFDFVLFMASDTSFPLSDLKFPLTIWSNERMGRFKEKKSIKVDE